MELNSYQIYIKNHPKFPKNFEVIIMFIKVMILIFMTLKKYLEYNFFKVNLIIMV